MRRILRLAGFSVCVVCGASAGAQTPAAPAPPQASNVAEKGTGLLMGQVVDSRGAGVGGALVLLTGGLEPIALTTVARDLPGGPRRTLTSADGRFVFFDLPAGAYSIEVQKPGFLPGAYGRKRYGGPAQSLSLADGERNTQVRVPIWEYATIIGTVRDEAGEPVVGVQVRALRRVIEAGRSRLSTSTAGVTDSTDDLGEYRLDALPPGEYVLAIVSTQTTEPAALVEAAAASWVARSPDPAFSFVRANMDAGAKRVGDWMWSSGSRLGPTVPSPAGDGRIFAYATTFHPGARSIAAAQSFVLRSGDERSGVDFQMQLVPTTVVSGTVLGPDGPVSGLRVRLLPEYQSSLTGDTGFDTAVSVTDATGRFLFLGVPGGQYTLRATAGPAGVGGATASPATAVPAGWWAALPLSVAGTDAVETTVTLRGGSRVSGSLEFDGRLPRPGPELIEKFSVWLEPLDPAAPRARTAYLASVNRMGQWTIAGVPPGRYYVIFLGFAPDRRAMAGWESRGATLGGRDVSTRPMDVQGDITGVVMTITDHPSELTGSVRAASGEADPGAAVLLFTTERDLWVDSGVSNGRFRSTRAAENGTFLIRGIPAGSYYLAAIPDAEAGEWQDPRLMDAIARTAARILIVDGEKKAQDVTTRSVR
jgi:hypothetical protein